MKKARLVPCLLLVLALLGMADASYVSHAIYTGEPLWCPPPVDGCNTVASSPHARIFGVPLAYFGLVFYSYMLAGAVLLAFDPFSRGMRWAVLVYTAAGVLSSIYFMYIQFTLIRAFCVYCALSAVLTLALLVAALWHFSRATPEPPLAGHHALQA
jgi:uncharacterized membrane protein